MGYPDQRNRWDRTHVDARIEKAGERCRVSYESGY